jgi:hypothetical protein
VFYFVIEVIGVSILVSIFATWIRLIPGYPKRKYALIQQLTNTALLTVFMTLAISLGVYPSWFLLSLIILFILWLSIRLTNGIVQKAEEIPIGSRPSESAGEEKQSH